MDFNFSPKVEDYQRRLSQFMDRYVYPAETAVEEGLRARRNEDPPQMKEIRAKAKAEGLWNLFSPNESIGPGLKNHEYAPLCELMGRSPIGPRSFNCASPDTGNIELLSDFGTPEQKERWLKPCIEGEMRSCFSVAEPESSGSDPTQLKGRAVRDGDYYVINAHKWFSSGALGAGFAIAMVVSNPEAPPYGRASMLIVPAGTPGFNVLRAMPVMGPPAVGGHCEILYKDCRVPATNLIGKEGEGFAIAQARLGPGRIHHCMRMIGVAERALELMCQRANSRFAFGSLLADKANIQQWVADSRIAIDSARLMVLKAAWKMDTAGKREARHEISMIRVICADMVMSVLERAIQVWGGAGLCDDFPLARFWRQNRGMRFADGPDEVHRMTIARSELRKWK